MADRVDMMNSYDHITDVEQKLILEKFEKALLNEVAPTGSGAGGGTEVADAYVNDMVRMSMMLMTYKKRQMMLMIWQVIKD